jgi:hypothetical protein
MADEHGLKTSAGIALSKFLRQVGQEKTEVAGNDPLTGDARVVTKTEQLARTIWRLALGYEEEVKVDGKIVVKRYKPDNTMISLVYDRLEGKVASTESDKIKKQPLSGKVSEQVRQRVNALAKAGNEEV